MATYFNDQKEINTSIQYLFGDLNYQNLYDIKLLAGRNRLNDTVNEYIINETYMKILGFEKPVDALGKFIKVDSIQVPIVGVMGDFNQRSLKSNIEAMALVGDLYRGDGYSNFNIVHLSLDVKNKQNWPKAIEKIENTWKTIYPNVDFELNFIDTSISQFYEQEKRTSLLLKWATGLAILISCLGLLGLVIYTTGRRTKEIGVRKILGANLLQLNILLSKEFMTLVGIAFVIAAPITWWGIDKWLQDFAFKADVNWWIFPLGGVAMLCIALVIMSLRTLSAARANPVEALRNQ
jgi:ABC-type antimicrobial peptide transport system permease subunit